MPRSKYRVVVRHPGQEPSVIATVRRINGARSIRDERVASEAKVSRKHMDPRGRVIVGPCSGDRPEARAVVMLDWRSRPERITIFDVERIA